MEQVKIPPPNWAEMEAVLQTAISCVAWLCRRDDTMAMEMRDEFMRDWEITPKMWNDEVAVLVDYAIRKAEHPAAHAAFEAVAVYEPEDPRAA